MPENDFSQTAFRSFLSEKKLMASICKTCGAKYLPPKPLCTNCYGEVMAWSEVEGVGELKAFTTIHIAPTAMLDAGYGREHPYCTGIVKLSDDLSISAQITGVDPSQPESIKIGTPMEVEFLERGDGDTKETFLAFHPVK
jgi:uncharacterized OB-fold protein